MRLPSNNHPEDHWISVSDLMAGLMIIFLFISVSYMMQVNKEKTQIKEVAVTYSRLQSNLYDDLFNEFKNDLVKWNAEIDKDTLSIRFKEPDVLFERGKSNLKVEFVEILKDFFPRYISILENKKYKDDIEEIRIEGHTSSEGLTKYQTEQQAYLYNMKLSQDRTRSVLEFILSLNASKPYDDISWLRLHLTANGLSSSKIIVNDKGIEDKKRSRRVEFRVKTNAQKRILEILEKSSKA